MPGDLLAEIAGQVERRARLAAADAAALAADPRFPSFDTELPVPLTVFVQDKKYLGNPPLSPVQYEAVRHAERVYYPGTYEWLAENAEADVAAYWAKPTRMVNFLTLEWGKGSGKDHSSRIMSLRVAYLLLCLTSPQAYYGLPEQDTIHLLNVATSSAQASRAFFTPLRRAVSRQGCWFQHISEAVEAATLAGRRRDPTRPLMNLVRFDRHIEAISGHSDADGQEGLNLLLGVADEIDGFKSRAELEKLQGARMRESASSAEAILDMLQTSASTRFPETFKNVRISYPRYLGSTIQKLTARAREDNAERGEASRHYVSGPLATWDVNPRVTRQHFDEDYRDDAVLARAKYECRPSRAVNPYFANHEALKASCYPADPMPLDVIDYSRQARAWEPVYRWGDLRPIRGAQYAMHADLAVSGDRAGIAMAHCRRQEEITLTGYGERGQEIQLTERRPVVRADFVFSFAADASRTPPLDIQIRWYRMLVLELRRRGFNIRLATADGFQSLDSLQILAAHGIETDVVSTDKSEEPWQNLRDLSYEGRLEMPDRGLLLAELEGLSRLPNGKIDHLGDGSKDEADALACALAGAVRLGGAEDPSGAQAYPSGEYADWAGSVLDERLPIGFVPPQFFTPDKVLAPRHHPDGLEFPLAAAEVVMPFHTSVLDDDISSDPRPRTPASAPPW